MSGEIIYQANEVALVLAFFALMVAMGEAGFRLGRRPGLQIPEDMRSQVSTVETGQQAWPGRESERAGRYWRGQ